MAAGEGAEGDADEVFGSAAAVMSVMLEVDQDLEPSVLAADLASLLPNAAVELHVLLRDRQRKPSRYGIKCSLVG
jgi:hypothetical protein